MHADVDEILIVSTPKDVTHFQELLGDGSRFGLRLHYAVQNAPNGIAEVFEIGESFIGVSDIMVVLGDNFLYGDQLHEQLHLVREKLDGCSVLGYRVEKPSSFDIVELDEKGTAKCIEEKPIFPKSDIAIPGIYFFSADVVEKAKQIIPSYHGELEITSVLDLYLKERRLRVQLLSRGSIWFDLVTVDDVFALANYVKTVQHQQGIKIACLEEIALAKGLITAEQLFKNTITMRNQPYQQYLWKLLEKQGYERSPRVVRREFVFEE
jgi:glucose-1-phosphate thymidylyltransferase